MEYKPNPLPFWGMPSVLNKFYQVNLELINYCANRCVFCCVAKEEKKRRVMSAEDLKIVLARFPDFDGVVNLSNTGDPILLDDLPEKIGLIKEKWPKCEIHCTSTLAIKRNAEYWRSLFRNGLDTLLLSCYAFTKEDYFKIHGSGNYDFALDNIRHIAELGKSEIPDMGEKFILRDLQGFNRLYPAADYKAKREKFHNMLAEMGLVQVYDGDGVLPMDASLAPGEKDHWGIPVPCHVLWGEKAARCEVHANLDIVPCCLFPENEYVFGNLREASPEEIFNGPKARFFKDSLWNGEIGKIPVCRTCYCRDMRASSKEEIDRIVAWQGARLRGREVIFWGSGQAYREYASFYAGCHPIAMIVDMDNPPMREIDGIPVKKPDILANPATREIPLVIFASTGASGKILGKVIKEFHRKLDNIYVNPPNYSIG